MKVQFGPFDLDLDTGELRKHGVRLKLQGKSFQILQALLERPGEVVTRDELKSRLWPGDTFVDFESGLNTAANRLRLALGDSAEDPRFIETVARTGYRFIGVLNDVAPVPVETPMPALPDPEPAPKAASGPGPTVPAKRRPAWLPFSIVAAAAALAGMGFWTATRHASPTPSFKRITFRRGTVSSARFGPDGQTILYSAAWDGGSRRLYLANTVSPESRPLDFKSVNLASVSQSSELALVQSDSHSESRLLRVPLNGGDPLAVATNVTGAEWSVDGKSLAVLRMGSRESVIEYPIGKVLYRTSGSVSHVRMSPSGDTLAFLEHPFRGDDGGIVRIVNRDGEVKDLSPRWASVGGVAWSPSGREVWFTAGRSGIKRTLYAATLGAKLRQIATMPGMLTLFDIAKDGRVLIGIENGRLVVAGSIAGEPHERDFSWFDWSHVQSVSPDGKLLLLDETGDGGGPAHSVYIRNTAADNAVRLGDGIALGLSPDARWALALNSAKPASLSLLPIGPDAPRALSGQGLEYSWARYFPDGKTLLVAGHLPGKPLRLFTQSVTGGAPVPINPETYVEDAQISPDGQQIAGLNQQRNLVIVPLSGGAPRQVALPFPGSPVQWSSNGKGLYVRDVRCWTPARIYRYDLASSRAEVWKELEPSDRVGLFYIMNVVMSPDAKSYAYSYLRMLSEIFVVDGWS